MKAICAGVISIVFLAAMAPIAFADSGQIVATQNIGDVCNRSPVTYRKTIIYVDLSAIKKKDREWGLTILNKLELGPREPLTILGVNPSTFEVTDVFDSCYPELTKSELKRADKSRGMWDILTKLSPGAQQRENRETFNARLRSALNRLVDMAGKVTLGPRRDILGALAIDKDRFQAEKSLYRLIIYTNGDIDEPEIKSGETAHNVIRDLVEKYSTDFSGANVYVYGVNDEGRSLESKSEVFSSFFLKNWGWLRSFSPSLPPQRGILVPPTVQMTGTFKGGGAQGAVAMSYTQGKGLDLNRAWLNFSVGRETLYVPLQGELVCKDDSCLLRATSEADVPLYSKAPYFRKGDILTLSGKKNGDFAGSIQPATPEVFQMNAPTEGPDSKSGKSADTKSTADAAKKGERVRYTLILHRT